jgi:4-hydroxy-3-polyprenylbenzoate decarboxylase
VVVAVTGASGAVYARRLLECLVDAGVEVHLICSPNGRRLFREELGVGEPTVSGLIGRETDRLIVHSYEDIGSRLASGSFETDGMIVCPASGNTVAAIAAGLGDNLITRAAAVTLKEGRRLIVVPREMPWSQIEIGNALRISQAGGIVCPASPGFYMGPQTIEDLADFVVGKLLDLVGVEHDLNTRWKGSPDAGHDAP